MRLLFSILASISLFLFIFVAFFWIRSYRHYEGILHYGEGKPLTVKAANNGREAEDTCTRRSSGWISFPGQLTYISIANPMPSENWDGWSEPIDSTLAAWAPLMASDAVMRTGLRYGSARTRRPLRDRAQGFAWTLPYDYFTVPYWLLTAIFVILPYRWAMDYRRSARRRKQGRCPRCGDKLQNRAGNCPACGEPIPSELQDA